MSETCTVKLFKNGSSQAIRLPAEFRFEGDEVYAALDDATGDVVLSKNPGKKIWEDFFAVLRTIDIPDDFMSERPLNLPPPARGVFDDEIEKEEAEPKRRNS